MSIAQNMQISRNPEVEFLVDHTLPTLRAGKVKRAILLFSVSTRYHLDHVNAFLRLRKFS